MKRSFCFLLMVWVASFFASQGRAAHYHYEEFFLPDVSFDTNQNKIYSWTFDLDKDVLYFWDLDDSQVQNRGDKDFVTITPDEDNNHYTLLSGYFLGRLLPENTLHYAYLTMRFTDVNNDNDTEDVILSLNGDKYSCSDSSSSCGSCGGSSCGGGAGKGCGNSCSCNSGGSCNSSCSSTCGSDGSWVLCEGNTFNNLDVTSYLSDHKLTVTITALSGDFKVDWVRLSGCFCCTHCDPIPEPTTIILMGSGLVIMGTFLRRYKRG